jgi:hypothetical protein
LGLFTLVVSAPIVDSEHPLGNIEQSKVAKGVNETLMASLVICRFCYINVLHTYQSAILFVFNAEAPKIVER